MFGTNDDRRSKAMQPHCHLTIVMDSVTSPVMLMVSPSDSFSGIGRSSCT